MSDIFEKIMKDMGVWSEKLAAKTSDYIQVAIDKGGELTRKGKIQIEIEVTKREYNKKIKEFGEYVLEKSKQGITDFSMDAEFIKNTEIILSLKKVIEELKLNFNKAKTGDKIKESFNEFEKK